MVKLQKPLRFSVPAIHGLRGAGLGNEIIPWGKAIIGAQELHAKLINPPWALNSRGYRRDFHSSLLDWPAVTALRVLPTITVNSDDAAASDDYAEIMEAMVSKLERRRGPLQIVHSSGMSGGYYGIRRARSFLRNILASPVHVPKDLYAIEKRFNPDKLTVSMHVRAGDFTEQDRNPQPGQFNQVLPLSYFMEIGLNLRKTFEDSVEIAIFTDSPEDAGVLALASRLSAIPIPERKLPLLSDIAFMASSDLLVCSISSLSMLAGFLSDKPYIWYEPHLGKVGGWRSIWGHEQSQLTGVTGRHAEETSTEPLFTRGIPGGADGSIPSWALQQLSRALMGKQSRNNLLMYGVV